MIVNGQVSFNGTGNHSVAGLDALPDSLEFRIGGKTSTNEVVVIRSDGWTDGNVNEAVSSYSDSTGAKTRTYNDRCINHLNRVSGTIQEIMVGTFVSFDNNGGGDYGFTINLTTADVNFPLQLRIHFP